MSRQSETQLLGADALKQALASLGPWTVDGKALFCVKSLSDYEQGLRWVRELGALAQELNHHPEILLSYGDLKIWIYSHDAGGITARDIEFAKRANTLLK